MANDRHLDSLYNQLSNSFFRDQSSQSQFGSFHPPTIHQQQQQYLHQNALLQSQQTQIAVLQYQHQQYYYQLLQQQYSPSAPFVPPPYTTHIHPIAAVPGTVISNALNPPNNSRGNIHLSSSNNFVRNSYGVNYNQSSQMRSFYGKQRTRHNEKNAGSRSSPHRNSNINRRPAQQNDDHHNRLNAGLYGAYCPQNLTESVQCVLVAGFIRKVLQKDTIIPLEVTKMCASYALNDLIIPKNGTKILASGVLHEYNTIIINKKGTLTTTEWNGSKGGALLIKCKYLKIKTYGKIEVNGKGYRGGKRGTEYGCFDNGHQGESYKGMGEEECPAHNAGGGGSGTTTQGIAGGGGGYGTMGGGAGGDGGGRIYGDAQLSIMYLGSGGGGAYMEDGGNGGGIVYIISERMVIEKYGSVESNGNSTKGFDGGVGGGGSGGSIYIKCTEIINYGKIEAKGGDVVGHRGYYDYEEGNGGYGRIRIDSSNLQNRGNIRPYNSV